MESAIIKDTVTNILWCKLKKIPSIGMSILSPFHPKMTFETAPSFSLQMLVILG